MYHPKNPYLHLYPPPPHPPPPKDLSSSPDPRRSLQFREFHKKHFVNNREFFQFALNPKPFNSQRTDCAGAFDWNQNGYGWNEYEGYYGEEGNEEWIGEEGEYDEWDGEVWKEEGENEEEGKVEFVLSDEMIAMFRFSELRRLKQKSSLEKKSSSGNRSSTSPSYATCEPDPSILSSSLSATEAQELYGDSYPTIKTLEAALNDSFVRSCDTGGEESVVYWPVLPMRFV
ncbi:9053_t:CDS:2 [Acaulospora colombiana]|uniref:9053_t:CDS:1 n=1 Tax=Acaulospora colombiana TaxID=27376 RepID=A0ACA9KRZ4_9GLOM|nr:9053_t:CDS:2 [Acaulospora colombiana]